MSFLFGETESERRERERIDKIRDFKRIDEMMKLTKKEQEEEERKKEREKEREIEEIKNILIAKLKELFPKIDMVFYISLFGRDIKSLVYETVDDPLYSIIKYDELNYNQFISLKIYTNLDYDGTDLDINDIDSISKRSKRWYSKRFYQDFIDLLDKIDPNIFMSNVNIDWKLLQLAKKDTSIHIPPSPPNAPPLPSPPKRSSPKKSKSKITNETLQEAKRKLKPKGPPNPPPLPKSVTRVRKPLQSPRKSTSNNSPKFLDGNRAKTDKQTQSPPKTNSPKSKLTKEGLEMAKSKLKPKGPPNPPPLPSPPKRSSPKKSKSKLTNETLQEAKSKLRHSQKKIKPDDPDYDLEMAFRKLEK